MKPRLVGPGGLSPIPRMERITLGDTSSGPITERPTWHSYCASSLRSQASMCRWNSPAGRAGGQGCNLGWWLRVSGSDPLPLAGSPSRRYLGKPGILGSGPRSSPSLAHCTALPGVLTPHRSSTKVPLHHCQVFRQGPEALGDGGRNHQLRQAWGHSRVQGKGRGFV